MKASKCFLCNKSIQRHDPNRVSIRVSQFAYREAHLSCSQKEQGGLGYEPIS